MTEAANDPFAALQRVHADWRKEVGEALARVRRPVAGVWERSHAVHYLTDEFGPRLDRERHILGTLAERLPAAQGAQVWAVGELLQLVCRHLCEVGSMAQRGPAFADAVNKLIRAFDFWCAEVEAAVGATPAGLAPEVARAFEPWLATDATPL